MRTIIKSIKFLALALCISSCAQERTKRSYEFVEVINDWTVPINKTNEEWKSILTPEQYYILREAGTERPFTHEFNNNKTEGVFVCAACNNALYSTKTKFDSGTGWPSFYMPLDAKSIIEDTDTKLGYARTEIRCQRCDGHLGHVFNDGPKPTGLRYCMNGIALKFAPEENVGLKKAVFAQGCFWCLEEIFESIKGVKKVISGYSGGTKENPTYQEVGAGATNYAEAVEVIYNPKIISYNDLLKVYYNSGDITQVNGQGPDHGKQYRSIVFYQTEKEKQLIESYQNKITVSGKYKKPISVEVNELGSFYPAEEYHQDYVKHHPNKPYVLNVSVPRYKKAIKNFPELLK